ncbi:hypothetical protein PCANC_06563 [Puccinia coronata f. sp. avenae]|uniref:Uncharacterized protein n=1 Tax=Puccinia coronata f. sp. avenae TaxID=200324 RepID=A0A2N5U640_9BASI|nr:hypothetical protein PCANC_26046 [Puccinia coronata f. sp. avenae]PLW33233.1 hypothetical protein PCASD_09521 [Puccinia coronata f. sp. avenae]PLW46852.1 hypothetical protein PCANC_06563 [Puccinia coronata f. sp. avenae]
MVSNDIRSLTRSGNSSPRSSLHRCNSLMLPNKGRRPATRNRRHSCLRGRTNGSNGRLPHLTASRVGGFGEWPVQLAQGAFPAERRAGQQSAWLGALQPVQLADGGWEQEPSGTLKELSPMGKTSSNYTPISSATHGIGINSRQSINGEPGGAAIPSQPLKCLDVRHSTNRNGKTGSGQKLLEMLVSRKIECSRATWYIRVIGLNEIF